MTETAAPLPHLRFVHVFAIGAGAMFSSGFFLLPGIAAAETGPSLPLAYLLAGLLAVPTILSVTELAVAMPRAGGPYHFYRRALGPTAATVGGIGLWVALVLKSSFALEGIDAYLTLVVDLPAGIVGIVLAVAFTVLNIAGARESAAIQVALIAVLIVVLVAFVAVGGITTVGLDDGQLAERFSPLFSGGALGVLTATGIVFVAFAGLPQVASVAGDIRDPARTIPHGIIAALVVATTVYVAGTAVLVAAIPSEDLRNDTTPIATAAETFGIRFAVPLVVMAALAAFASTGNAGIMSASRYPLALARDGIVWARFARLNDAGVPVAGVLLSGATIAVVVTAFDVEGIAKLASAFVLISFAMMNASVIILRRARVPGYRPSFRVPWSPWVPGLGVLTSVVLVIDLGPLAMGAALVLVVAGAAWHRWVRRGENDTSGALLALRRRRGQRLGSDDIAEFQQAGPRAEDAAPETLEHVIARRLDRDGGRRELRREVATELADAETISVEEASAWLAEKRHAVLELDDGSEVHLIGLDSPAEPVVALAWGPADGRRPRPDTADETAAEAGTERRGLTVAAVAAFGADLDRAARLVALLAVQLDAAGLREQWPVDERHVGPALATDASRRQGADLRPPATETTTNAPGSAN
jgi:basic amino acid/polyamine antiporter, APA family